MEFCRVLLLKCPLVEILRNTRFIENTFFKHKSQLMWHLRPLKIREIAVIPIHKYLILGPCSVILKAEDISHSEGGL